MQCLVTSVCESQFFVVSLACRTPKTYAPGHCMNDPAGVFCCYNPSFAPQPSTVDALQGPIPKGEPALLAYEAFLKEENAATGDDNVLGQDAKFAVVAEGPGDAGLNGALLAALLVALLVIGVLVACMCRKRLAAEGQTKTVKDFTKRHRRNKSSTVPEGLGLELGSHPDSYVPTGWERRYDANHQVSRVYLCSFHALSLTLISNLTRRTTTTTQPLTSQCGPWQSAGNALGRSNGLPCTGMTSPAFIEK